MPLRRVGAFLRPESHIIQVFGANTDVGKTIVSTILCKALQNAIPEIYKKVNYLKPVYTGSSVQSDVK